MLRYVCNKVYKLIARYGDDGYGDKPDSTPRFTYWFQHLDVAKLTCLVEGIHHRPATHIIVKNTKPPSGSPKCRECKMKITRGQLSLVERQLDNGHHPFSDDPPCWKVSSARYCCIKAGCTTISAVNRATRDDGVTAAELESATVAGFGDEEEQKAKRARV